MEQLVMHAFDGCQQENEREREIDARPGIVGGDEVFPHSHGRNVLLACTKNMTRTCILK